MYTIMINDRNITKYDDNPSLIKIAEREKGLIWLDKWVNRLEICINGFNQKYNFYKMYFL